MSEYMALGVREYWVIDRFQRIMTVYTSETGEGQRVAADEIYRTPLLPGFELPLAQLLSEADRWQA
ncbi:MAG: Uma2 family endonuclease [Planctomycetes bacterium]|nr:Uma2 family endonuclease [Planctomycetota bacterium]